MSEVDVNAGDPLDGKVWVVDLHDEQNAEGGPDDPKLPPADHYGEPAGDDARGELPAEIPDAPAMGEV